MQPSPSRRGPVFSCSAWLLVLNAWGLVLALSGNGAAQTRPFSPDQRSTRTDRTCERRWLTLSSVRRLHDAIAQQQGAMDLGDGAARWTESAMVAEAVLGSDQWTRVACAGPNLDLASDGPDPLADVSPEAAFRNRAAYGLLALGYSPRETADVVSGRIRRSALDQARRMIMAGRGREAAAAYLDDQYRRSRGTGARAPRREPEVRLAARSRYDDAIERHARHQGISPILVRAVIQTESAFDPLARSSAGALGLMQLMPATARSLGVDPWVPEQNLEGGIRYLASLLREFGTTKLALVAYNGGPGFARRYARGEAALYGETRQYVHRITTLMTAR